MKQEMKTALGAESFTFEQICQWADFTGVCVTWGEFGDRDTGFCSATCDDEYFGSFVPDAGCGADRFRFQLCSPEPAQGRGIAPEVKPVAQCTQTSGGAEMGRIAFPLGKISASREVLETVNFADICAALDRHEAGDWGEILPEIKIKNGHALVSGGRLASAFRDRRRVLFWVFTNGARTETRVELAVW